MKLSDVLYKIFKWLLLIFVPAILTLLTSISNIYNLNFDKIILTISVISTFIGVITGISNRNYYKEVNK